VSEVTVIGAGIIGICAAIALQDVGYRVEVIDRGLPEVAASYGNCGLLAVGEVVPISKPGILLKIPKWLLDSQGPLHVRPSALIGQLPWLMRFLMASRRAKVESIASALAPILHRAEEDYRELFGRANLNDGLVQAENLMAMNSKSDFENDQYTWSLRSKYGFKHTFLNSEEIRALEPSLGGPICCGVLLKGWLQFSDPGAILNSLQAYFISRGGIIRQGLVKGITLQGGVAKSLTIEGQEPVTVLRLLLAAGAWSGKLARDLGMNIPVAALQGYHHQLPRPGPKLNRPVIYANGGFVLTPLTTGLRIGGTIEIAGHDPVPNFSRADILAEKAKQILPGLDVSGGRQWMGPRPFMPDSLPVIDRAPHHSNVFFAFGHGQVGQTLGATTGRLIAELVSGKKTTLDLGPFRATRFS